MKHRIALDMGETSIGWAVFELAGSDTGSLRPVRLVDLGVQLFSNGRDPKTGDPLAAARREPKAMRRRRDRTLQRRAYLLSLLESSELLPPAGPDRDRVMALDPYKLRARGVSEMLTLYELGRIVFHLNQRRGFKSNRKTDPEEGEEGKIASASERLREQLAKKGLRTLGQFLATRQSADKVRDRQAVRIRLNGKGAQAYYDFYPMRAMVEEEFDILWGEQSKHYPALTEELRDKTRAALLFQRPLKDPPVGRCSFFPDDQRLARSRPLAQEFLILQDLNNLEIDSLERKSPKLSLAERDLIAGHLMSGKKLSWDQLRKKLKLSSAAKFNLEEGGRKELSVNPIAPRFEGTKAKPGPFPKEWGGLPDEVKIRIIEKLETTETEEEVAGWASADLKLDEETARRLSKVRLPDGHLRIGERACRAIVEQLRKDVCVYSVAAEHAELKHSDKEDGEFFDRLPAYNRIDAMQRHIGFGTGDPLDPPDKRYGRISNPTVHIALNQVRRVVNALIDRYGKPEEVVLEIARDLKKSQREKEEYKKRNEANRAANDSHRVELVKGGHIVDGERRIADKLMRLRLWKELGSLNERCCPYTGEVISMARLLSDEVEIEHILPLSKTLDDSPANKTVSMRRANRLKRNLSPAEAADRYPDIFDKAGMIERARSMPKNKRWRFEDDAMQRFEEQKSFMDRQLRSTQYLSRLAREYVSKLFPAVDETGARRAHVWVVTGSLTSLLRHRWGLNLGDHNRKSRNDHRHHAIDAAVIGVIDRSLVQRLSTIAAKEERDGVERRLADLDEPFNGYVDQVRARIDTLMVAHRAKHGHFDAGDPSHTSGKLHEDTYYGKVRDTPENAADLELGNVVRRKPVVDLKPNEIGKVRDLKLRAELAALLERIGKNEKALAAALAEWSSRTGVRRVRVLKPEDGVTPICDRKTGQPYKYVVPAENAWIDIVETPDGVWRGAAVDSFAANSGGADGWQTKYPDATFIMRLRKGDVVQLFDADGVNSVKKVYRIGVAANLLYLAPVNEGGELQKRHDDKDDPFRWDFANIGKLKPRRARRVRFTPAGRMKTVPYGRI